MRNLVRAVLATVAVALSAYINFDRFPLQAGSPQAERAAANPTSSSVGALLGFAILWIGVFWLSGKLIPRKHSAQDSKAAPPLLIVRSLFPAAENIPAEPSKAPGGLVAEPSARTQHSPSAVWFVLPLAVLGLITFMVGLNSPPNRQALPLSAGPTVSTTPHPRDIPAVPPQPAPQPATGARMNQAVTYEGTVLGFNHGHLEIRSFDDCAIHYVVGQAAYEEGGTTQNVRAVVVADSVDESAVELRPIARKGTADESCLTDLGGRTVQGVITDFGADPAGGLFSIRLQDGHSLEFHFSSDSFVVNGSRSWSPEPWVLGETAISVVCKIISVGTGESHTGPGEVYLEPLSITTQDTAHAFQWARPARDLLAEKACDAGDAEACNVLKAENQKQTSPGESIRE
jgi:hypothetical protein